MPVATPVIRRSHTKSKQGCQTCRARRVKCDEFRPQCRNCLLANRQCTYLIPSAGECSKSVSSPWPATVESSCQRWKHSGQPPFPILQLISSPSGHHLSISNLRHIHHLALVATILDLSNTRQMCLWWGEFSIFVQLANRFDFVAHAITGHSAGRLAVVSKTAAAFEEAAYYRNLAIQGLTQAIDSFSRDNADAVLCASLCLSNQEDGWQAWRSIIEGISMVIHEMQPWAKESLFCRYLDHSNLMTSAQVKSACAFLDEVDNVEYKVPAIELLLAQGISSLNRLAPCPKDNPELSALIRQLRDVCRAVYEQPRKWSLADQFRLIHPFAAWMDKYSISYIDISEGDVVILATLAHFYAAIVALALAFPRMNIHLVISIRVESIIKVDEVLRGKPALFCGNCKEFHTHNDLMSFPLKTVELFRERHKFMYI